MKGPNGWLCAPGFAGTATKSCKYVEVSCSSQTVLSGCQMMASCQPPLLSPQQSCYINLTACNSVRSGNSCQATCASPFAGAPTLLTCPVGNTDSLQQLSGSLPSCDCGEPSQLPIQYNRTGYTPFGAAIYSCANGYAGTAVKTCLTGAAGGCSFAAILTGCYAPRPCAVSGFLDDGLTSSSTISGTVKFGPALVGNIIREAGVIGYSIFLMDKCGRMLGSELTFVPVQENQVLCCRADAYAAVIATATLTGTSGFLIIAQTETGEAPTGKAIPMPPGLLNRTATTSTASSRPSACITFAALALAALASR